MSAARRCAAVILAAAGLVMGVGACGGPDAQEQRAERAAAAQRYAAQVAGVTETTRAALAATSADADYRDADAAAGTTRAYAATIRSAGASLARAEPPASVAASHRELAALYATTAEHLDALAARFPQERGARRLSALAQELSSEVQALSTREAQLRSAIDRGLAAAGATPG